MRNALLFFALIWWGEPALADTSKDSPICASPPFEAGEMARFVTKVGQIKVGEGTTILRQGRAPSSDIPLAVDFSQMEMWWLEARAISTPPVSLFYKVNDSIDVWMQPGSLVPHRQEIRIDQSNERAERRVLYDHTRGIAHFRRDRSFYRKNSDRERVTTSENPLAPGSFEPISLLFHLRCVEAAAGRVLELPFHENRKSRRIKVHIEAIETIKTPIGPKEAFRARIEVYLDGKLQNEKPFKAWVSNDERRVPLRFVANLKFANLKAVLVGYRPSFAAEIEGELDPAFETSRAQN